MCLCFPATVMESKQLMFSTRQPQVANLHPMKTWVLLPSPPVVHASALQRPRVARRKQKQMVRQRCDTQSRAL